MGTVADLAGSDPLGLGALLHVALPPAGGVASFALASGPEGTATQALPIPNNPGLAGKTLFAQALWSWPPSCPLPPVQLSSSRGLSMAVDGGGGAPTELLSNGSFTAGTAGWTLAGDFWAGTQFSNYKSPPGYSAGGVNSGGLAINNASGTMHQDFTLPPIASAATLRLWTNVTTNEPSATPYDFLTVTLRSPATGAVLATPLALSNADSGPLASYSETVFDLGPWLGQSLRLSFQGTSDVGFTTTFRIDDVGVTVN